MGVRNSGQNRTVPQTRLLATEFLEAHWPGHCMPTHVLYVIFLGAFQAQHSWLWHLEVARTKARPIHFTYKLLKASALSVFVAVSVAAEQTCAKHLCQMWVQ